MGAIFVQVQWFHMSTDRMSLTLSTKWDRVISIWQNLRAKSLYPRGSRCVLNVISTKPTALDLGNTYHLVEASAFKDTQIVSEEVH
jgi:hypothetical protein